MVWGLVSAALAQGFSQPLAVVASGEATVTKADGATVVGDPGIGMAGSGTIKKLSLKLPDGSKLKFVPEDLKEIRLVPSGMAKMATAASSSGSIMEVARNGGVARADDSVRFVSGTRPNGKPALMQVLNPGFDQTLTILADPAARETGGVAVGGVQVSGGVIKSYLVMKGGQTGTFLVKKGDYDKQWDAIFGGCAAMARPAQPDWNTFAAEVAQHASACAPAPAP